MLRDTENIPSFPEKGFNAGLDDAQIVKNSELLERFGNEKDVYTSVKELFMAMDRGSDWKETRITTAYCLSSLRAQGVNLIPEIEDFFTAVHDETEWYRILVFLEGNREALLKGTYRNDGNLVASGKILGDEKDVVHEEKIGPYVRNVMPGVNMIAGTYPRLRVRLGHMITGGDGVDDKGVKIVAKGFKFIRDEFLPKLEEALQHFLSSRSEAIFAKMISVRKGFDKVLSQKHNADMLLGRPIVSPENTPVPEHWTEEYKNFMHQLNLMYAVYDKLEDVVFRLSAVADGGAHVEAEIEKTRNRFLGPLLRGSSSRGYLADSLEDASLAAESSRGAAVFGNGGDGGKKKSDLERDLHDYMTDAKLLMGEMTGIIGVYMKALMHSGVNETHPEDVREIEKFLK